MVPTECILLSYHGQVKKSEAEPLLNEGPSVFPDSLFLLGSCFTPVLMVCQLHVFYSEPMEISFGKGIVKSFKKYSLIPLWDL